MLDRIAVRGKSADDWSEALEIVVLTRPRKIAALADWFSAWQQSEDAICTSAWQTLSATPATMSFARSDARCPAQAGQQRIYRALWGKKNVYLLSGIVRGSMSAAQRAQWQVLLDTAKIAN